MTPESLTQLREDFEKWLITSGLFMHPEGKLRTEGAADDHTYYYWATEQLWRTAVWAAERGEK